MSLLVHLPLNGNLNNYGLADINMTSTSPQYVDGKIGKCALFNASISNGIVDSNLCPDLKLTDNFSFCFWVKNQRTSEDTTPQFIFTVGRADAGDYGYGMALLNNVNCQIRFGSAGYKINIPLNTWTHVTFTKKRRKVWIYKDGILLSDTSFDGTLPSYTTYAGLGLGFFKYSSGNIYPARGQLNDFRIYDHCLSPKEVKEISKGLIVHYKLDDIGIRENLFTGGFSVYKTSTTVTKTGYLNAIPAETILANKGKTLILSAYVYSKGQSANTNQLRNRFGIHGMIQYTKNGESSPTQYYPLYLFTPGADGRVSITWTVPTDITDATALSFADQASTTSGWWASPADAGVTWYYKDVKLEWGTTPTMYTSTNAVSNTIYDCSGYNNDGTITGTLSLSNDSPRYNYGIYFNGSSYIKTLPGELTWSNYEYLTISAWMKPTVSAYYYTGSIGIGHEGNATYKEFAISNAYPGKPNHFVLAMSNGNYTCVDSGYTCPLNEWHHYAVTLNGTTLKMYVDGSLIKTQTINWNTATNHTNPQFQVGVDLPETDEKYTGYYSDIRIYTTALSDADIKELYDTSAFITDNGTTECYEFDEVDDELSINKNGIMKIGNLYESSAEYTEDVTWTGSGVTRYTPIANSDNQCTNPYIIYFDTPNKKYICELDFEWGGNWAAGTGGTYSSCLLNAMSRKISDNTWTWGSGYSSPLQNALRNKADFKNLIDNSPNGGSYHYKVVFDTGSTYNASQIRTRTDYSDGNGWFSINNLKIYPYEQDLDTEQTKIGDDYITSNNFIEI